MANYYHKGQLFSPALIRSLERGETRVSNVTLANDSGLINEGFKFSSGTFRYDPPGQPLKSTQQLNIDFSKLENHTFFNSAKAKTQAAFERIINHYPFDSSHKNLLEFKDLLTGYENYVYTRFPKNVGYLNFNRATGTGNHLIVKDYVGASSAVLNKGNGKSVLDLTGKHFTVEMQLFVPSGSINDNEVIFQRLGKKSGFTTNNHYGLTLALSASNEQASPTGETDVYALLSSGSFSVKTSAKIQKGEWNHIAVVFGANDVNQLTIWRNAELYSSSSVGSFGVGNTTANVTIGSGSQHSTFLYDINPQQNLSASIDELRYWHVARSQEQLDYFSVRNCFSEPNLKLAFRFNEPSGSFTNTSNESLALDYSGNGFHSKIENFDMTQRATGTLISPLTQEKIEDAPVLFPSYQVLSTINDTLMTSASNYDFNNPNLITNLVPKHYLAEAAFFEGFESEEADIGQGYSYFEDKPGGGRIGAPQLLAGLLFTMANQMDDLKLFVSEMSRLLKVDAKHPQTISEQFLPFLAKYYGLNLPSAFGDASIQQLKSSSGLRLDKVLSNLGLQQIQNTIWRRILSDLPELLRSRGTRHCIEALLRNIGINPNGLFRIREYGGSRRRKINDTYEKRHEIAAMLDFSGSLVSTGTAGVLNAEGIDSEKPYLKTNYLFVPRVEPGVPTASGTFVRNSYGSHVSSIQNDFSLLSGSWAAEGLFKFEENTFTPGTNQSLMRIMTTGSQADGSPNNFLIFNVVAYPPTTVPQTTGSVVLYGQPNSGSSANNIKILLTGTNVFNGNKWHVSFGRKRNDFNGSFVTSSYFLRAGTMTAGRITNFEEKEVGVVDIGRSVLNWVSSSNNASGTYIAIGSQSLNHDHDSRIGHLNYLSSISAFSEARTTNFSGKLSGVRFYSKHLSEEETITHIRNFKSVGVENPLVNYSFNTSTSGSWERLRLDLSIDQAVTNSQADRSLQIFDFSQNLFHATGSGFEPSKGVIKSERFDYEILSPRFELAVAENKVRVRSWTSAKNMKKYGGQLAPMHEIPQDERPKDDRRLSVEVSCVQALNEDIINIFSTLDAFDEYIGAPELVFAHDYPELRNLRKIYFNRLQNKVSLEKFFKFYKWFDDTVGDILEEFLPSSTNYLGTNFIVESHALERAKFVYNYSDMYIGEFERTKAGRIYLQQFLANIRKF